MDYHLDIDIKGDELVLPGIFSKRTVYVKYGEEVKQFTLTKPKDSIDLDVAEGTNVAISYKDTSRSHPDFNNTPIESKSSDTLQFTVGPDVHPFGNNDIFLKKIQPITALKEEKKEVKIDKALDEAKGKMVEEKIIDRISHHAGEAVAEKVSDHLHKRS